MEQKDEKRIFYNIEPSETFPAHIQMRRFFTAKAT